MDEHAKKRVAELYDSGEMVNLESALALDEGIYCKRCGNEFTLAEGKWEGTHPDFSQVKAFGIMCPTCERVNVAYYKTDKLFRMEQKIRDAKSPKQYDKAIKKYQREFVRVQKHYGNI